MSKTPNPELLTDSESVQTPRKNRLFEAGHMKLVVLYLISLVPKHGYEIIKEIGEIVGGGYTPSAGTIYPTLNYLEDMQFISAEKIEGDRKQYSITQIGVEHLNTQQAQVENILGRFETRREIQNNQQYIDIHRAMENLKTSLRLKLKNSEINAEEVRLIAEQIDQAAVNIGRL